MIKFDEAAEKIGADSIRYLFAGANTASDVRFGFNLGDEARRKLLGFWNIVSFFNTYAELDNPEFSGITEYTNLTDRWLSSRMNQFLLNSARYYENYDTPGVVREFELCVEDVSNWYIRVNRKRFWKDSLDTDKLNAYTVLFSAIKTITQVMSPIIPFMSEKIWQEVVKKYDTASELSVHLSDFPRPTVVNMEILSETENARKIINLGLKLRNEVQTKVKQPLAKLYLCGENIGTLCADYGDIIKEELNIKEIVLLDSFESLRNEYLTLNFKVAGRLLKENLQKVKDILSGLSAEEMKKCVSDLTNTQVVSLPQYQGLLSSELFILQSKYMDNICVAEDSVSVALLTDISEALKNEGIFRELLRSLQVLRKEAGFEVSDRVQIELFTNSDNLRNIIEQYKSNLEKETLSTIGTLENSSFSKDINIDNDSVTLKIR